MRIIITTGGTGGHIFPALAFIEEIRTKNPSAHVLFVGAKYGMEEELCKKHNINFKAIEVQGFIGKGLKSVKAALLLLKGLFKAIKIIRDEKIDIVVGFGGYASAPSLLAAKALGKQIYFHEQNAFPGAVHRTFAVIAKKIFLAMPLAKNTFSENILQKCMLVGNPVRKEITSLLDLPIPQDSSSKKLLVLGGSLGAHSINRLIISLLEDLHKESIEITHQCGKSDYDFVKKAYENSPYSSSCVQPFISNMQDAYKNADFIIARAGASTIAELACASKASILIPFPHAAHNHQFHNAHALEEKQACLLLEEKRMYKDNEIIDKTLLLNTILLLAQKGEQRYTLARNIRTCAMTKAPSLMYDSITKGD